MSGQIQQGSMYTVQPGDTLSGIAERAYSSGSQFYWMALYSENQNVIGDNPNVIRPGESLYIPPVSDRPSLAGTLYIVKPGDTLFSIAERAGGGELVQQWLDQIYTMNKQVIGNDPNLIHPGQVLLMPTGGEGGGGHM